MIEINKQGLYVALRCVDRVRNHLKSVGLDFPQEIDTFINGVWEVLRGSRAKVALTKIDRLIERLIIDEQDADFEGSRINRLYYILSDLILYLKERNGLSVDAILEEALELFRYEAENEYLISLGGNAMAVSALDEEKIESDPRVTFEKHQQSADRKLAQTISDWTSIDGGIK
jgi:hypothetical protein